MTIIPRFYLFIFFSRSHTAREASIGGGRYFWFEMFHRIFPTVFDRFIILNSFRKGSAWPFRVQIDPEKVWNLAKNTRDRATKKVWMSLWEKILNQLLQLCIAAWISVLWLIHAYASLIWCPSNYIRMNKCWSH